MRSIPAELKTRIEKAQQTLYENADPHMNIFVYNSRWNELFTVYTVHNKPNISRIDVTAKREMASTDPNKLYAIYIEDGVSHVISKPLPYNELIPWTPEFTVGSASDVAIEFNGYWERDQVTKRFNFIADDKPWVFKQSAGSLTAQHWDETPITLATGVGRACALRGWLPAQPDHTQDQGLIVAYLKSGTAYYRNYCLQSDGTTYLWDTEQEITQLPTGLTDIALFRTNDFRIGVLGRDGSNNAHMTVTVRNFTGMSLWPEHISANVTVTAELIALTFSEGHNDDEHISATALSLAGYCPVSYDEGGLVASHKKNGSDQIEITFKYPLLSYAGFENLFVLTGEESPPLITSTAQGTTNEKLILNLSKNMDDGINYNLTYESFGVSGLRVFVTQSCQPQVDNFTLLIEGQPPNAEEFVSAGMTGTAELKLITILQGYKDEHISAGVTGTADFWHVDDAPV